MWPSKDLGWGTQRGSGAGGAGPTSACEQHPPEENLPLGVNSSQPSPHPLMGPMGLLTPLPRTGGGVGPCGGAPAPQQREKGFQDAHPEVWLPRPDLGGVFKVNTTPRF